MMEQKLQNYATNQLPGGKYWSPTPEVKEILSQIQVMTFVNPFLSLMII